MNKKKGKRERTQQEKIRQSLKHSWPMLTVG